MEFCPNFKAVLVAEHDDETRLITRTRCKQWSCPYCWYVNQLSHRQRIISAVEAAPGQWSFHTLTAHSKARGAARSLANIRGAWDRLVKRAKRRFGKFAYVRVYEPHADGSWHVHALWDTVPDDIKKPDPDDPGTWYSRALKKAAAQTGMGYITNSQPVTGTPGYIAGYVVKYMTKDLMTARKDEVGRLRRIQYSQGWTVFDPLPEYDWAMLSGVYDDDVIQYTYLDIQTGHVVTLDDFQDTFIYPREFDRKHGHDQSGAKK